VPLVLLAPCLTAAGHGVDLVEVTDHGATVDVSRVPAEELPDAVARREAAGDARWVMDDVAHRYPPLLAAGVRLFRAHDLRLCHAILRRSTRCAGSALAAAPRGPWDEPCGGSPVPGEPSLFDELALAGLPATARPGEAPRVEGASGPAAGLGDAGPGSDLLAELVRQLDAVAGSADPGRLRLLLAAESTGALLAAEMRHDGMPWSVTEHDRVLTALLGPRPAPGARPARLEALAAEVRALLDAPALNPDSQPDLLHALRRAGLDVASTRRHEIAEHQHPVVAPLLEYKALARLLSANGWTWLDTWVHDGRFRPDYVVGGVVTGRWATSGGGALQLPAAIRSAVRADPGHLLVVADAKQLEPRVLAALSGDAAMAGAARGSDLYQALVDVGAVDTRSHAKTAMLGAIYGATTGTSAALLPRLTSAFPRAIAAVQEAAQAGERGEQVTTWLGRSSPVPGARWQEARRAATGEGSDPADVRAARSRARDWGRFTRNFVVQGTAAEWALCWLAALRRRLREVPGEPHLVFFLHDEVIVHTPAGVADVVVSAVQEAAAEAGRLLFGRAPVEFALDVSVVESYDQAA
jgi:DNA polymerase-1